MVIIKLSSIFIMAHFFLIVKHFLKFCIKKAAFAASSIILLRTLMSLSICLFFFSVIGGLPPGTPSDSDAQCCAAARLAFGFGSFLFSSVFGQSKTRKWSFPLPPRFGIELIKLFFVSPFP